MENAKTIVKLRFPNVTKTLFSYPWSCDVLGTIVKVC